MLSLRCHCSSVYCNFGTEGRLTEKKASLEVYKVLARQAAWKDFYLHHHMSGCIDFNRLREKGNCWAWRKYKICLMRFFVCATHKKGIKDFYMQRKSLMLPEFYKFFLLFSLASHTPERRNNFPRFDHLADS